MNQGVHTVDLLVWFLGEPVEVFAWTGTLAHERIEVEDVLTAVVKFDNGALATIHATTAANPGAGVRIGVHGDGGTAALENDELVWFVSAVDAQDGDRPGNTADSEVGPITDEGHSRFGGGRLGGERPDRPRQRPCVAVRRLPRRGRHRPPAEGRHRRRDPRVAADPRDVHLRADRRAGEAGRRHHLIALGLRRGRPSPYAGRGRPRLS